MLFSMQNLNSHIIYEISKYLPIHSEKALLITDKESYNSFNFKDYKVRKIQRWWRNLIVPCINGLNMGYKVSIDTLINNPNKFQDRYIETMLWMRTQFPNWERRPHKPNPIFYKAIFGGLYKNNNETKIIIGGNEYTFCVMYDLIRHKREQSTVLNHTLIWWNETSYTWQHDCNRNTFVKGSIKVITR